MRSINCTYIFVLLLVINYEKRMSICWSSCKLFWLLWDRAPVSHGNLADNNAYQIFHISVLFLSPHVTGSGQLNVMRVTLGLSTQKPLSKLLVTPFSLACWQRKRGVSEDTATRQVVSFTAWGAEWLYGADLPLTYTGYILSLVNTLLCPGDLALVCYLSIT